MDRQILRVDRRYYEWTSDWTGGYYEWKNEYYEWINEYHKWKNEYYKYYKRSCEYYEYYEWSSEYHEDQTSFKSTTSDKTGSAITITLTNVLFNVRV